MPADDERDPLDRWLDRQVRPLPPPPGTFELITKRARRRKIRKVAVTLVSAAAVAAAVAIAVPGGLLLKVSPSQVSGNSVAAGGSRSPGTGTQSPNGTGSRDTASPSASQTTPNTEPSGPVPANFAPTSVTFVSPDVAWVIGQAGTPGKCANVNPDICTSIARTDNAGKTWEGEPAPNTSGPDGPNGVSAIRYLDGVDGWAFGPELWATHNAGYTWTQVPTDGNRVTDLETAGNRVFALWASCPDSQSGAAFASGCTNYTLMSAAKASDAWAPVGGLTSGLADQGNPTSAVLALAGGAGYLLAPDGTLYEGSLAGGAWQKVGTAPCQPGPAQADGLPSQAFLAVQDAEHLAVACYGSSIPGGVQVSTSSDGGQLWTTQSPSAWSGITNIGTPTSLAAASGGVLVLATTTGLYVLPGTGPAGTGPASTGPASTGQWQASNVTGTAAPAGGFTYVGMTTSSQGVAVPADTGLHEIYLTYDGGATWTPSTPIAPGR